MKKGIESLKEDVLRDCKNGENCFNENGCDHEFYRYVPEDNPKLIEMGITTACLRVSKCFHKYCDKYKWAMDRANHYAEKTGKSVEEIIEIWESDRSWWYMNYYQDGNQPIGGRVGTDERITKSKERTALLKEEIETYEFLSTTLEAEHQQSVKKDLIIKVNNMKGEMKKLQTTIQLYEISCFAQ